MLSDLSPFQEVFHPDWKPPEFENTEPPKMPLSRRGNCSQRKVSIPDTWAPLACHHPIHPPRRISQIL